MDGKLRSVLMALEHRAPFASGVVDPPLSSSILFEIGDISSGEGEGDGTICSEKNLEDLTEMSNSSWSIADCGCIDRLHRWILILTL